jgi:hypothetical protein
MEEIKLTDRAEFKIIKIWMKHKDTCEHCRDSLNVMVSHVNCQRGYALYVVAMSSLDGLINIIDGGQL